jgi:hypothetical protein
VKKCPKRGGFGPKQGTSSALRACPTSVEIVRAATSDPLADQTKSGAGGIGASLSDWWQSVNRATVSKVVDPDTGEPLVVYHGTAADVEFFDPLALGANTQAQSAKGGFFLAASPKVASGYAAEHCGRLFAS